MLLPVIKVSLFECRSLFPANSGNSIADNGLSYGYLMLAFARLVPVPVWFRPRMFTDFLRTFDRDRLITRSLPCLRALNFCALLGFVGLCRFLN